VQAVLGIILTIIFVASAEKLAGAFVPVEVRETSLKYVRISSVQAFSSAVEVAVSSSTRALDHPDVPLLISCVKVVVNIVLDLLIISKFHVGTHQPTINTQAWIRLSCDVAAAAIGFAYFCLIAKRIQKKEPGASTKPSVASLAVLVPPGIWTFLESALRNSIYLWLIHGIVSMGSDYATAWGVFNTIRWGLIMVPVQSLEQSTLAFVGHAWGDWRAQVGPTLRKPKASWSNILSMPKTP
jgi:Na+-driven multidrug efflux pump